MKKLALFSAALLSLVLWAAAATLPAKMNWNFPPGWQTNGISFNIRYWDGVASLSNFYSWPLMTNVSATNITLMLNTGVYYGVSATNSLTGNEYIQTNISPVSIVFQ